MKRLILDHLRRWSWVLGLVAALEFGLGYFTAKRPNDPLEFFGLMLAMWAGAILLGYDLKKGLVRGVTVLPLTARQIGRSWWLATIAVPAVGLAALLFLGAGLMHQLYPDKIVPLGRLAILSLFNLTWLSTTFNCAFSTAIPDGGWSRKIGVSFISLLSVMMLFGGMLLCQNASKDPLKSSLFLALGALLTGASWFRAERCLSSQGSFRPAGSRGHPAEVGEAMERLMALRPPATGWGFRRRIFDAQIRRYESNLGMTQRGEHRPSDAYGGVVFLIHTTLVRPFLTLLAMVALMTLIGHWQGQMAPDEVFATMGSFMSCFFIFFLQPMFLVRHLRFLRTLPISATKLTAVMMACMILPLAALGVVVTGFAGLSLGTAVAITTLKSYAYILAPASLCVFFSVWQGAKTQIYAWLLLILFGFQLVPEWLPRGGSFPTIPRYETDAFIAFCVLLAFLLTRWALLRSSLAFRVHASSADNNFQWQMGR